MPLSVPVVYGSVRTSRLGIRAAHYLTEGLRARGLDSVLVDPAEHDLPMLDRMFKEYEPGEAPAAMQTLADLFQEADAFVIVSGEYNHLPPPALTNLLDHFKSEFARRPAGIVTYSAGLFGGIRAGVHLRDMLAELGMVTLPGALAYPRVGAAFDEDGRRTEGPDGPDPFLDRFAAELTWYAEALKAKRDVEVFAV
jgi:NAD(P)H-dependent FMN reductase